MIEATPDFRRYQRSILSQARTGGIVILQYRSRDEALAYLAATVADPGASTGGILHIPESGTRSGRKLSPLIGDALLAHGYLGFTALAEPEQRAVEQLQESHIRIVTLIRHCKAPRSLLLELVVLAEAAARLAHPVVFVLATSEDVRALLHREPALEPMASVAEAPRLSRADLILLLKYHGYEGDGLATLARLADGNWGIVCKLLATVAAGAPEEKGKRLSRDAVMSAAQALQLAPLADKLDPEPEELDAAGA
ncbi:MAG: hypothetical protein ACREKL_11810 [Chthoniobacterales bacterium]